MASKVDYFLNKTLGEDFFESLSKVELWKPGTKTTIDHEEIKTAFQLVPRIIMALLIRELSPMEIGETKEINLPIQDNPVLKATKMERDVFTGNIRVSSKEIVDFKYRSLPGIGLVIMSAFELYDVNQLNHEEMKVDEDVSSKVQKIIDERLALHELIGKVVDKKIMEREAVQKLVLNKLTEIIKPAPIEALKPVAPTIIIANKVKIKKESPVKAFLESRKNKFKKSINEFSVKMAKGETVDCPDCGGNLFDGQMFASCICYGDCGKVFIKKSEEGIKVRFSKNWDTDNIEMLLEVLRRKHGK